VWVDRSKIPAPQAGSDQLLIIPQAYDSAPDPVVGAFRTECRYSHVSFDDPIVYPGQPGAAHLHAFYGNTAMDAYTTTADNGASSTCAGARSGGPSPVARTSTLRS